MYPKKTKETVQYAHYQNGELTHKWTGKRTVYEGNNGTFEINAPWPRTGRMVATRNEDGVIEAISRSWMVKSVTMAEIGERLKRNMS